MTSWSKLPLSMAATARWCERSAQASISSRVTLSFSAAFQPTVMDIYMFGASGESECAGEHLSTPSSEPVPRRLVRGLVELDCLPTATHQRSMPEQQAAA